MICYKSKHVIAKAFFGTLFSVHYSFMVFVNFIMLSNQFLFFLIMTVKTYFVKVLKNLLRFRKNQKQKKEKEKTEFK